MNLEKKVREKEKLLVKLRVGRKKLVAINNLILKDISDQYK